MPNTSGISGSIPGVGTNSFDAPDSVLKTVQKTNLRSYEQHMNSGSSRGFKFPSAKSNLGANLSICSPNV